MTEALHVPATTWHQPAVINWPTRSVGAAKHVRWQRWLAQTLRFVSPPSGQHARGFQMGFEPQLAGRLVYNERVYNHVARLSKIN